ncbi:mechanosensitive ion channel family protein [Bizionia arctica]|uniref:Mechanosensitive ion channel n=1 Tax=Bizionia arctica TaxID=1495645 RepID=A0A917GEF2_9FLAO|nr:mechanosensitive ion channel domain-containing protein [Bizionia arctica]GGG41945.1 hypothetical protein GCM10010976_11860 [Bizionia arctica]
MTRNYFSFFKPFFTILFVFGFVFGFSQNKEPIITKDSTKTNVPTKIHVVDVIDQLELTTNDIKEINKKIAPDPSISKIDSLFPSYQKQLNIKLRNSEYFISANPNRQKINNLLNKWYISRDYLKDSENTINDVILKNSKVLIDVSFKEKVWQLTYENAIEKDVPREITDRLNKVTNDLHDIKLLIVKRNNDYLLLESKINIQLTSVNNQIQRLQGMKSSQVYDLLYLRHPPIWKTSFKKSNTKNTITEGDTIPGDFKSTVEFFKTFENKIYLFFIIAVCIFLFFRYLKNGFELHDIKNENLDISKDIISKKYVITSLFACFLIAKLYFINAPILFDNILVIGTLITSLPIAYNSLNKKFQNIVYVIILFNILEMLKTYVWFETYQYRFYLLFEAFIVIASLYYFTHPYFQTRKLNLSKFSVFIIKLTPIIYFLAIVSIVSNILGYTNLTDITLKICTQGSVLSIMFYAILLASKAILIAMMHRHYARKPVYSFQKREAIEKKLIKVIHFVVLILWVLFFLNIIDQLNPLTNLIDGALSESYTFGTITLTIASLLSFLSIIIISFLITSFISFIFDDGQGGLKFLNLPKGVPAAISLVIRYIIIAFGIVFALSSLGIDLGKFNLMAGALGLGIGFGLQNVISNFVAGLILVFERPILPGDTVEVNNLMGIVKKIGVRSSKVSTFDGADVIVPNTNLISNDLINWTLSDNIKRVEILIGTSYDSDPNQILELLTECANSYINVIKEPIPVALFSDFGDSSLNFKLRFWVHFEIGLQAKSDVSIAIYNKFKELGIEIPFPQQDVHIKDLPERKKDIDLQ